MGLAEKITSERKKRGLTQQQLAELTNLTSRTIQRIENGASIPRAFTITAIAEALGTTYEALHPEQDLQITLPSANSELEEQKDFLELLTLCCFSFIIIPLIHFLVPIWILKKSKISNPETMKWARKTIRTQIIWTTSNNLLLLACLAFNLISVGYFKGIYIINFLLPFLLMYFFNAFLIVRSLIRIKSQFRS
jgi:transcriptional regulator with XRE-family HTH domain